MILRKLFFLFALVPLMLTAQVSEPDSFRIDPPIFESPPLTSDQADVMARSQYKNWGITRIGLGEYINKYSTKNIKMCTCDTGLSRHKDTRTTSKNAKNFTTDMTVFDNQGHSTWVVDIQEVIARDATHYTAKVLNDRGSGASTWVRAGMRWCWEQGADVINLSLGGKFPSQITHELIKEIAADSVLIIAAAGNAGQDDNESTMGYPALYPEVIAVGSINEIGQTSWFSSSCATGEPIRSCGDVMAAGERVIGAYLDNTYISLSGTSMATPFVSGMAALKVDQMGRRIPYWEFREMLHNSTSDIAPSGFDVYSFFGEVTTDLYMDDAEPPIDTIQPPADTIPEESEDPNDPIVPVLPPNDDWWTKNWGWFIAGVGVLMMIGLFLWQKNRQNGATKAI